MPLGHTYTLTSVSTRRPAPSGSRRRRLTREYTLTGLADTETPAGTFRDCACVSWSWRRGSDVISVGVMRLAKGVGQVYAEHFGFFGTTYEHLLSYEIPSDPSMPAVKLRKLPRLPTTRRSAIRRPRPGKKR